MHRPGERRESETTGVETYRRIQERDAVNAVTLRGRRRCRLKTQVNRKRPPPQEEHRLGKVMMFGSTIPSSATQTSNNEEAKQ